MRAAVRPFTLPLADPLETARGTVVRRDGFLFRLVADDGTVGVGEATPFPGWTESREECETALADAADAVDAGTDPDALLPDLDGTPAARHAVDLALTDVAASRAGEPLYRRLDGPSRVEPVPVNATVGDADVDGTVAAAERAAADGFECLKVKVGARPLPADVERVEAVASATGAELRADANGAWSRERAQQFLDATGDRLAYVEQPVAATDLAGLSALAGKVALDETLTRVPFEDAVGTDPHAVVLKPMALGGPRRTVELAERARAGGILPVVTTTVDGAVARAAAVHVAAAIPDPTACGLATADRLAEDLGPDPAPVTDGRVRVPQEPGVGTEVWR